MLTLSSLAGGLGLFLLGMWLMTDGLKLAAGETLRAILDTWTSSRLRGLLAGFGITALVQSSSAVTVATVGFVNAGLLTLPQAIAVVYGSNVGTTMTAWLVALIGVKVDVTALALPLLGIGMAARLLAGERTRWLGAGQALAGFGAFFLGVGVLNDTFAGLAPNIEWLDLSRGGIWLTFVFFLLGVALTTLMQSSSAAIAIALTAGAGQAIPLPLAAAAVIGTNVGTTTTALFASIGSTPAAKRVATAHIVFNVVTGGVALLTLPLLVSVSSNLVILAGASGDFATKLAVFHTLVKMIGLSIMWPLTTQLSRWLNTLFIDPSEAIAKPKYLDQTTAAVPAVALRGLLLEVDRMRRLAAERSVRALGEVEGASASSSTADTAAVLALGQEIRGFIGKLDRAPLSADTVSALSDLIRAVQHIEDWTTLAEELPLAFTGQRATVAIMGQFNKLTRVAHTMMVFDPVSHERQEVLQDMVAELEALKQTYQALKQQLLQAAALGSMPVHEMEGLLQSAQRLRDLGEAAYKTERRLAPVRAHLLADGERKSTRAQS